jgi:hypothetical protein
MKARVDAGTDVAMLAAWDASLQNESLRIPPTKAQTVMQAEAVSARAFVIETGSDGGGDVEIYVDESPPQNAYGGLERCGAEHLLHLPSGQLMVGGAEDYRRSPVRITSAQSIVQVPPGDYAVSCYVPEDDEATGVESRKIAALVGEEDYTYYKRMIRRSTYGYLLCLLFFVVRPAWGWKVALGATLAVVLVYFWIQEKWILARNTRYQSILRRVNESFRKAQAESAPVLILMLQRVTDDTGLGGGVVRLHEPDYKFSI